MNYVFSPEDDSQRRACTLFENARILFLQGRAGTGKTHTALGLGLRELALKHIDQLILTRPNVECGPTLGYVPGTIEEKFGPWLGPLRDVAGLQVIGGLAKVPTEIVPLQYIQGRTFRRAVIIADEMQNATPAQMIAVLTRIGYGSKLILTGDVAQTNIGSRLLLDVSEALKGAAGVARVTLQKQYRDPLVDTVLQLTKDLL